LALFPENIEPFYAGFGNRDSDTISYKQVQIPLGKTYIINPKGEIKSGFQSMYKKSYSDINEIVDNTFPWIKSRTIGKANLNIMHQDEPFVQMMEIEDNDQYHCSKGHEMNKIFTNPYDGKSVLTCFNNNCKKTIDHEIGFYKCPIDG
jgi:hypothetical protein